MSMMHILITIDNTYLEASIVTLNSLFCNNSEVFFHVHVIHYNLSDSSIKKISGFVRSKRAEVSFYKIEDLEWANGKTRYWDKVVLLKLFAWQVLSPDIDRILYLDSDVLVLGDIRELWEIELDGYYFAMRGNTIHTDMSGVYARHTPTGHTNFVVKRKRGDYHYNAGVIMMNLKLLRDDNPEWKNTFIENYYRLFCPEEHLICMLWYERILSIADKWNQIAQAHPRVSPVIIHYIPKPWSKNKDAYYINEYLKYCDIPECESLYNQLLPRVNSAYPHSIEAFLSSWHHIEILNPQYIEKFLSNHNYQSLAICGINTCTDIIMCKLSTQEFSHVEYFIDDYVDYRSYNNIPVFNTQEFPLEKHIDCVVISDYERYSEYEIRLQRLGVEAPIVSIIEIIYS